MTTTTSDFEKVGEFHRKFGLPATGDGRPPHGLDRESARFRLKFLLEEVEEYASALGMKLHWAVQVDASLPPALQDLPKALDSLVDLSYVALGTAHLHAFPWDGPFAAVHAANMRKQRAAADGANSARGSALDVVKPAGWEPPTQNVIEFLMRAGWRGPGIAFAYDKAPEEGD